MTPTTLSVASRALCHRRRRGAPCPVVQPKCRSSRRAKLPCGHCSGTCLSAGCGCSRALDAVPRCVRPSGPPTRPSVGRLFLFVTLACCNTNSTRGRSSSSSKPKPAPVFKPAVKTHHQRALSFYSLVHSNSMKTDLVRTRPNFVDQVAMRVNASSKKTL